MRAALEDAGIFGAKLDLTLSWIEEDVSESEELGRILRKVDASPYDLSDWVSSALWVRERVIAEGRPSPLFPSVCEYLGCCCSLGQGVAHPPPLMEIVEEAFQTHGYEGEEG